VAQDIDNVARGVGEEEASDTPRLIAEPMDDPQARVDSGLMGGVDIVSRDASRSDTVMIGTTRRTVIPPDPADRRRP
jgi:hypothetical protein